MSVVSFPARHAAAAATAVLAAAAAVGGVVWYAGVRPSDRDEAVRLASAGDFASAEPALAAASARDPWDAEVAAALARVYLATADPRAEAVLVRWEKASPDDPEPVRLRMDLHWKANDPRAADCAKQLVRLQCRDPNVRYQALECTIAFGMYDEAELRCRKMADRYTDDLGLRVKLAQIQRARDNAAGAAATLDALLKEHPNHAPALLARAELYRAAGWEADALPLLQRAYDADPARRREVGDQLATALDRAGRADEASRVRAELGRLPDARP